MINVGSSVSSYRLDVYGPSVKRNDSRGGRLDLRSGDGRMERMRFRSSGNCTYGLRIVGTGTADLAEAFEYSPDGHSVTMELLHSADYMPRRVELAREPRESTQLRCAES